METIHPKTQEEAIDMSIEIWVELLKAFGGNGASGDFNAMVGFRSGYKSAGDHNLMFGDQVAV